MHVAVCQTSLPKMLLHGQGVGQLSRVKLSTIWNNAVLFGVHKLKSHHYIRDAQNKPADLHRMHLMLVC